MSGQGEAMSCYVCGGLGVLEGECGDDICRGLGECMAVAGGHAPCKAASRACFHCHSRDNDLDDEEEEQP